jgi:hypothetical protein
MTVTVTSVEANRVGFSCFDLMRLSAFWGGIRLMGGNWAEILGFFGYFR